MKRRYIFLLIFILTGIAMYVTNPKANAHKEAVYKALSEVLTDKKKDLERQNLNLGSILKELNDESMNEMVKPFIEQAVKVQDYKVFSISKIDLGEKVYPVGIGIFGKVFIAPQLKTAVKENLNKYF